MRSESGKVCLGKREKSIHLAREKYPPGAELVLWQKYCKDVSDELKKSKDEMRRKEGG